ncbi:cupin domain-containing protein [Loktanella sp. TSTF-M6]|uniref:Cupin domain-containing protein n=1 Tax=Loktanella gaetbuli TaxID=2881335 RepID=A0ABS8BT30_9RHOB|nr:cupin domain-containing protein [Loktanella gaetbuli]MCB5198676.1 cupin domain-containing protein [Loktanella gaetbuli]
MTEDDYRDIARSQDYGTPQEVSIAPDTRRETHTHDQTSFVYVISGRFILNTAEGSPAYDPGDIVILPANIPHAEEAGPEGATILVARK